MDLRARKQFPTLDTRMLRDYLNGDRRASVSAGRALSYLAAFAVVRPLGPRGAAGPQSKGAVREPAPLVVVATDRAVLRGYEWALYGAGLLVWLVGVLLFQRFVRTLARSDDDQLRWLRLN
jgi:hypothetical protein